MAADVGVDLFLRAAELRDVRSIREIDRLVYPKPWSEKLTIEQVTRSDGRHLVAERDHRVIAHGAVAFLADDAHITTVAVHPAAQRLGVGRTLVRELAGCAAAVITGGITLEVRVSNESAINLYESLGFESAGTRPGYYGDTGEDALIMWKDLEVARMRNDL